jgi:hypothetical protein
MWISSYWLSSFQGCLQSRMPDISILRL